MGQTRESISPQTWKTSDVISVMRKERTQKNKIFYDPLLSDKKKGKMCFTCTNHKHFIMFVTQIHIVKNVIVSVRQFVFQDRLIK